MGETANIIIADTLQGLGTDAYSGYLAHALCLSRNLPIEVQWRGARATCRRPMIVRKGKLVEKIQPSEDFRVKVIYIASGFVVLSTPQNNYGMKGQLSLFLNPIMSPTTEQQELCLRDFEQVEYRLRNTDHHFHRDMLIASTQMLILDFFDFHSHLYGEDNISVQNASIMSRFLNMLENGTFREHREVTYYADCLCVTSKYLSEVSRK